jgi:ribonucleotide reductase alpha subunit
MTMNVQAIDPRSLGEVLALGPSALTRFEDVRGIQARDYFLGDTLAINSFNEKYSHPISEYFGPGGGFPLEGVTDTDSRKETPAEAMFRVAHSIGRYAVAPPADMTVPDGWSCQDWTTAVWFHMHWNRQMVYGGRPYFGAGTRSKKISLINCTTVGQQGDSIEAIFNMGLQVAKVESRGEGVGGDITDLRPKHMPTSNAARSTSGAVHWGEIMDWATDHVSQNGRRGALLISIEDHHPDAYGDFITVKSDLNQIKNANISIKFSDEFMKAYENGGDFRLWWADEERKIHYGYTGRNGEWISFGTPSARDYFAKVAKNAYDFAEPGVLFWDTAKAYSNSDAISRWAGHERWNVVGVNACFPAGTMVMTDQGHFPIESLVGRKVTIWDGKEWKTVDNFRKIAEGQDTFRITMAGGMTVDATANHEFILQDGSRKVLADIEPGDQLKWWNLMVDSYSNDKVDKNFRYKGYDVVSVEHAASDQDVYCCTVDGSHSFTLSNGLVVGNCSEQPMNHLGQCTLAHKNLATLPIVRGLTGTIMWEYTLAEARLRARFVHWLLDSIVEAQIQEKRYALPEQLESLIGLRRVGAGFSGGADFLALAGIAYDSEEGIEVMEALAKALCEGAYRNSVELGKALGAFPENNPGIADSLFMKHILAEGIIGHDEVKWLRNVCSLTIAPVGTGALMLQNYGSGIEGGFGPWHYRRSRASGEYIWYFKIDPFVKQNFLAITGIEWPYTEEQEQNPDMEGAIKSFLDYNVPEGLIRPIRYVDPFMKLRMMGAVQKWIDSAISVTFNLEGETCDYEDVEKIYYEGWKQKLKGVSVYVYNDSNREPIIQWVRPTTYNFAPKVSSESINMTLTTPGTKEEVVNTFLAKLTDGQRDRYARAKRPERLEAETVIRKGEGKKWYFTLSKQDGHLAEVFVNTSDTNEEHPIHQGVIDHLAALMVQDRDIPKAVLDTQVAKSHRDKERDYMLLCRMISIALRWEVPVSEVVQAIRTGLKSYNKELVVGTLLFHLVHLLEEYVVAPAGYRRTCTSCGGSNVESVAGCMTCLDCGGSKCG